MRTLVVTAVPPERDAVSCATGLDTGPDAGFDVLAAGVGPAAAAAGTAGALTRAALAGNPYDLVVCAGIGGGFGSGGDAGGVAVASAIVAADLGAQTSEGFRSVAELGFGTDTHRPPEDLARAVAEAAGGGGGDGSAAYGPVLTVSTVTGTAERAVELARLHPGAVAEAMEGFGVAEAAAAQGVPVLEVRTISNPVGLRNRAAWRIPEALATLTEVFGKIAPVVEGWKEHG
jgi:futalosine hydrolase